MYLVHIYIIQDICTILLRLELNIEVLNWHSYRKASLIHLRRYFCSIIWEILFSYGLYTILVMYADSLTVAEAVIHQLPTMKVRIQLCSGPYIEFVSGNRHFPL
jgi:hypothetical protein